METTVNSRSMPAEGKDPTLPTTIRRTTFLLFADGKKIAYVSGGGANATDSTLSTPAEVRPTHPQRQGRLGPDYSPNGGRIATSRTPSGILVLIRAESGIYTYQGQAGGDGGPHVTTGERGRIPAFLLAAEDHTQVQRQRR